MSSLGNKKVELYDTGGGDGEPTAEDNVQMASSKIAFWSYLLHVSLCTEIYHNLKKNHQYGNVLSC